MNITKIMFVAFAALVLTMLPENAMAVAAQSTTGNELMTTIAGLISGSLGTLIGLGLALFGLYMWLIQQESWGIMVMIGGVALTAFPGIFQWMTQGFDTVNTGTITTGNASANL